MTPAIVLTVVDSVTNQAPNTAPVVRVVSQGDTVSVHQEGAPGYFYSVGWGRSGRFQITVKTAGYSDWAIADLRVAAGSCGAQETVTLTAKLQR